MQNDEGVHDKVDAVLKSRSNRMTIKDLQEAKERKDFAKKVEEEPIMTNTMDRKYYNWDVISLGSYIKQMSYPDSIYLTDELIRLSLKADLEMKQKYLDRKRKVPMNMIWILIIFFGNIIAVLIIAMFGGAIIG